MNCNILLENNNNIRGIKNATKFWEGKSKADLALNAYRKNAQAYPQLQLNKDVKIELHQIPRPKEKNIQQSCITAFWGNAFGQATPVIDPLP